MRVGIIGCGAIGQSLGSILVSGEIPGLRLVGMHGIDTAQAFAAAQGLGVPALDIDTLLHKADLLVEATAAGAMPAIVRRVVAEGKTLVALSVGGFALEEDLLELLEDQHANVFIPSGGVVGIDGLLALREAGLDRVTLTTTKSPRSLEGAPYFAAQGRGQMLHNLEEARVVFEGTAREAILGFPANANLAITLSLAGLGFDNTEVRIIADPKAQQTEQCLEARAGNTVLRTSVRGIPLPENPRTSQMAVLSVKALLRKIVAPLHIGT